MSGGEQGLCRSTAFYTGCSLHYSTSDNISRCNMTSQEPTRPEMAASKADTDMRRSADQQSLSGRLRRRERA